MTAGIRPAGHHGASDDYCIQGNGAVGDDDEAANNRMAGIALSAAHTGGLLGPR